MWVATVLAVFARRLSVLRGVIRRRTARMTTQSLVNQGRGKDSVLRLDFVTAFKQPDIQAKEKCTEDEDENHAEQDVDIRDS